MRPEETFLTLLSPRIGVASAPPPMVVEALSTGARVCRCGTKIPRGSPALQLRSIPTALSSLFQGESFCSFPCLRAQFLEQLATIESIATPAADAMVVDLREMYAFLAASFARLVGEWSERLHRQQG